MPKWNKEKFAAKQAAKQKRRAYKLKKKELSNIANKQYLEVRSKNRVQAEKTNRTMARSAAVAAAADSAFKSASPITSIDFANALIGAGADSNYKSNNKNEEGYTTPSTKGARRDIFMSDSDMGIS